MTPFGAVIPRCSAATARTANVHTATFEQTAYAPLSPVPHIDMALVCSAPFVSDSVLQLSSGASILFGACGLIQIKEFRCCRALLESGFPGPGDPNDSAQAALSLTLFSVKRAPMSCGALFERIFQPEAPQWRYSIC